MPIAVIADIVGSRLLDDRSRAQNDLERAISRVNEHAPKAIRILAPTVGDELQGEYPTLRSALASVLLLRLAMPEGVDCRFGVGIGAMTVIESEAAGGLPEGPAWWAARAAIDEVHRLQKRTVPEARTRIAADQHESDEVHVAVDLANAGALASDQVVTTMSERARRLAYGRCVGMLQKELAESEGITQSAVSQQLASSGAPAVVEGYRLLRGR